MNIVKAKDADQLYKLAFEDLGEAFFSGLLLTKLSASDKPDPVTLSFGLSDIFVGSALDGLTPQSTINSHNISRPGRDIATMLSVLFGSLIEEELPDGDARNEQPLGTFFENKLSTVLGYLRDGDSMDLKPAIESFEKESVDEIGAAVYRIVLLRQKFVDSFKDNIANRLRFQENAHQLMSSYANLSQPAVAVDKQLEFLRSYLDRRKSTTGETTFSFQLKDVNFRRVVQAFEGAGGHGIMPTPLSSNTSMKALLPFILAAQGELDIDRVRITSPAQQIDEIDIQFSIRRPAIRNVLGATYCALTPEKRQLMSEAEINVYEDVVRQLQSSLCFALQVSLSSKRNLLN